MCSCTCKCFEVLWKENTRNRNTDRPVGDAFTGRRVSEQISKGGVGRGQMETVERQTVTGIGTRIKKRLQRKEFSSLPREIRKDLDAESRLGSKYLLCRLGTPGVWEAERAWPEPLGHGSAPPSAVRHGRDGPTGKERNGIFLASLKPSHAPRQNRSSRRRGSSKVDASSPGVGLGRGRRSAGRDTFIQHIQGAPEKTHARSVSLPSPLPAILCLQLLASLAPSHPSLSGPSLWSSAHHITCVFPPSTFHNLNRHRFCIYLFTVSLLR